MVSDEQARSELLQYQSKYGMVPKDIRRYLATANVMPQFAQKLKVTPQPVKDWGKFLEGMPQFDGEKIDFES